VRDSNLIAAALDFRSCPTSNALVMEPADIWFLKTDFIDLCAEFGWPGGWPERRIPSRMCDPAMVGIGYCSSLAILFATEDPRPGGATVDPRSGGSLAGKSLLRHWAGCSSGRPGGSWPSLTARTNEIRRLHALDVSEAPRRVGRQGGRPPTRDLAPGSSGLTRQVIEVVVAPEPEASRMWRGG
jgi:hypothetical protein